MLVAFFALVGSLFVYTHPHSALDHERLGFKVVSIVLCFRVDIIKGNVFSLLGAYQLSLVIFTLLSSGFELIEEIAQVRLLTLGLAWLLTELRFSVFLFCLLISMITSLPAFVLDPQLSGNRISLQSLSFGLLQSFFIGAIIEISTVWK